MIVLERKRKIENKIQSDLKHNFYHNHIEPWYNAYALQGVVFGGLLPMLLPLMIIKTGSSTHVGLVMAVLSLGGLSAPIWGGLADRFRLHRTLLSGGMIFATLALCLFIFSGQPWIWILLAFIIGIGASSSSTVANLFVVEDHPKPEWDERIGWLQTYYGIGQVAGLFIAGPLSQLDLKLGMLIAGMLCALSALIGWWTTRTPGKPLKKKPVLRRAPRLGDWGFISPQRLFHHLNLNAIRKTGKLIKTKFGVLLVVWLLTIGGSAAFFSQYPIVMQKVFSIPPIMSSTAFAIMAGLGLLLYSPAGSWSEKISSVRVLRFALGFRWIAYVLLFVFGFVSFGLKNGIVFLILAVVVNAWSIISVSGTSLAAQLSQQDEGEGMGIFNAVNSLAGVIGAAFGGLIAGLWGYRFIAVLAVGGIGIGLLLSLLLPVFSTKSNATD